MLAVKPTPVNTRKEVASLAKQVGELVKAKKGTEAMKIAEEAEGPRAYVVHPINFKERP